MMDTEYAINQYQMACEQLGISTSPNDPGDTLFEAVVRLKLDIEYYEGMKEGVAVRIADLEKENSRMRRELASGRTKEKSH